MLTLIGLTGEEQKLIKNFSDIEKDLLCCKNVENKLRDFFSNEKELKEKAAWEVKNSKLFVQKRFVNAEVAAVRDMFKTLTPLVDKENNIRIASELSVDQVGPFLMERSEQAKEIARKAFLKLHAKELLSTLKDVNHTMRKRISNTDKWLSPDEEWKFSCYKTETSWEKCLEELEEKWQPQSKNGNVTLDHFISCLQLFKSLEIQGGEFITASDLLDSLRIPDKRMKALDALVQNLPILMARQRNTIILLNVLTFLRSDTLIAEMMKIVQSAKSGKKGGEVINITPGEILNERKPGSGRPRIIDKNPEILEKVRNYAETNGVAAHDRRRTDVGRFGFCMEDVQEFLKNSIFKEDLEKVPSLNTIRRMFEAPSQSRNSKFLYKSDIMARPGVKRNDAPGTGEHHLHSHECFASFRLAR